MGTVTDASYCVFIFFTVAHTLWSANVLDARTLISSPLSEESPATIWSELTTAAGHVYLRQNQDSNGQYQGDGVSQNSVLVLLQGVPWSTLVSFEKAVMSVDKLTRMTYREFPENSTITEVNRTLLTLSDNGDFQTVVAMATDVSFLTNIVELVSTDAIYKWTSLLHTTEWTLVSTSKDFLNQIIHLNFFRIDFATVLVSSGPKNVLIGQKSRTAPWQIVASYRLRYFHNGDYFNNNKFILHLTEINQSPFRLFNFNAIISLRKSARLYLKTRRSVMSDLTLPVAITEQNDDIINSKTVNNQTVYDGYSVALLNILAEQMGFEYRLVVVKEGSYYGSVLDDGLVTGITGSLARRETALTTLPMSRNENRRSRIDFSSVIITFDEVRITYRLPEEKDHLDLTYINIFKPDIYLYLTGVILGVGILGAIVHVMSSFLHSPEPMTFANLNLRSLTILPDLFFFRTESIYNVQSGLILWTSWAIFWFILSSAYSAYLVTTFTVKTPELTIKTLQDLLNNKDFSIGMNLYGNALETFLGSSKDPIHREVWNRILQKNNTNPGIFNLTTEERHRKVMTGKYAWIQHSALDVFPPETYPDVRTYVQSGFEEIRPSCIATPQNVFYSQALNTTLLYLEEAGILEKLRMTYIYKNKIPRDTSKVSDNQAVTLHRIELPVYCVAAGVGIAAMILIFEIMMFKYRNRKYRKCH